MLFVLMPFVFSLKLQDVEQSPRFLFIALVVSVSSVFSLIFLIRKNIVIRKDKIFFVLLLFLIITLVSLFKSINYADGLFEFLKLLIFYSLFFLFLVLFSFDEKNKLIFFKSICFSAITFIAFGFI